MTTTQQGSSQRLTAPSPPQPTPSPTPPMLEAPARAAEDRRRRRHRHRPETRAATKKTTTASRCIMVPIKHRPRIYAKMASICLSRKPTLILVADSIPLVIFFKASDYMNGALARGSMGDIVKFLVPRSFLQQYAGRIFTSDEPAYASLVRQMRTGGPMHSYDWLEGPVTRDPDAFLRGGPLTAGGHQISFHTPEIVQVLSRFIVR